MFSKQGLVYASVLLVVVVSLALSLPYFLAFQRSRFISPKVRPAVRAVVEAELWSKVTDAYWEDEMENQFRYIANNTPDKIEFLKGILLCCELDGLRAITFGELVANDAALLRDALTNLGQSSQGYPFSRKQLDNIQIWIRQLEILEQMNAEQASASSQ